MIFATYWFVVFAPAVCLGYRLLPGGRLRLAWLLAASLVFHRHFAGAAGMLPIAVVGTITFALGLTRRPGACALGIVISAAALCTYKYAHFVASDLVGLASAETGHRAAAWVDRVLPAMPPLAISFFTFEFVHYLVEVRRGGPPIRSPIDFALFTVFFPSLAAGPIKRYAHFLPAVHGGAQSATADDLAAGFVRVVMGYCKKVVIADNLTSYVAADASRLGGASLGMRWLFLAALAFRILADFSGYSDIAIGLARMLGVRLPENFAWPYLAVSTQDFWQRWHISLSTWIRDYVYIPLGGDRHGAARRAANAFVAMVLCGLWHGPAWNFVVWGIYHGVGLTVSAYYRSALGGAGRLLAGLLDRWRVLGWTLTTLFVWLGWLLFFYPVPQALRIARLLVTP
jgi:alginate O-acetyltransferase complex protein AlgI